MAIKPKRADGWWYPYLFVGGMLIVIAVNGVLAYFAVGTWTGLQSDNHYRRGLEYNKYLEAAEKQKALGWTAAVKLGADKVLSVRMTGPDGAALAGLDVLAVFERPTSSGHDFDVELAEKAPGLYTVVVNPPLPGQWDVRIVANSTDGKNFQLVERLNAPE